MLSKLTMPSMSERHSKRIQWYHFTLLDDSVITKKLKEVVLATEDKPRINIFDDNSFTVGQDPVVFCRQEGEEEWTQLFRFKGLKITYTTNGDKDERRQEEESTQLSTHEGKEQSEGAEGDREE